MDAVQRIGIPGCTLGMGGCGAESKNKDIVSSVIISYWSVVW